MTFVGARALEPGSENVEAPAQNGWTPRRNPAMPRTVVLFLVMAEFSKAAS